MHIRIYQESDYSEVFKLWKEVGIFISYSDKEEEVNKILIANPKTFLVGTIEGKVIGTVIGGYDGRRGLIHHLAVLLNEQGKGYGKKLMLEVEKRFAEMGVVKSHLLIDSDNRKVIDFYIRLGWELRDLAVMSKTFVE
ncbi:MAG: GNAT family N-acetyltransferase [Candidatus Heimdallarchaeota archaeon]|nr:GNAT family N-acetyltransferase [Candidatus Heimdallarchaeota archaeon]MCK5048403.1 GNAT family N-acetyltransferase [Candidatus Heimdallarchaeota archaeon]